MAETDFTAVEIERKYLEDKLNVLIRNIGNIPITKHQNYAVRLAKGCKRSHCLENRRRGYQSRA
ncbi:MAG: hypothetical protein ACLUFI_09235 [Oscillospiraceae bacterium]